MPQVKIFTTTTCPYCHALKDYLNSKGVKYEEVNLNEHPEQMQTSVDACGQMGVPCTHIVDADGQEQSILGFDKSRINKALNIN